MMQLRAAFILGFAIGICFMGQSMAFAQGTGKDLLEQRLRNRLDRILTSDEYVTDVRLEPVSQDKTAGDVSGSYLPGFQILGSVKDIADTEPGQGEAPIRLSGKADLLIIFDRKVSKERMQVALDIVNRLLEAEGLKQAVKLTSKQQDISKIPLPLPQPPPPKQERDPSLLEIVIHQKDFVGRALLILWGAIASLMTVHFALRRLMGSRSSTNEKSAKGVDSQGTGDIANRAGSSGELGAVRGDVERKTKNSAYSKDEALLSGVKEMVEEAKAHPKKVARVLGRWVSQSSENARFAAIFIKNCDIRTIEAICNSLHPSDLEKIIANEIADFDPVGDENQKVLDRMRSDLALLASEHLLKERPDPLDFLKILSDDDIRTLLSGEDLETVALVSTQIPPHRMQKFLDSLSPEALAAVVARVSTIQAATLADFEVIRNRLSSKTEKLGGNLFNDKARAAAVLQLVGSVRAPTLQCRLMENLREQNPAVHNQIRDDIFLATDFVYLSDRMWSVIVQSIDADTLGRSLSELQSAVGSIGEQLSPAYRAVFQDALRSKNSSEAVAGAWSKVSAALKDLMKNGLITRQEVLATIRKAESASHAGSQADNESKKDPGSAA